VITSPIGTKVTARSTKPEKNKGEKKTGKNGKTI